MVDGLGADQDEAREVVGQRFERVEEDAAGCDGDCVFELSAISWSLLW